MMHRDSVSTEAISIGGKVKQGERPKDIWVCPVLSVTRCARTVGHQDLTGVPSHLGFPTVQLSHVTAHVPYILLISILSVLSSAFSSPTLLQDLARAPLAAGLITSCRDWEWPLWTAVGDCPLLQWFPGDPHAALFHDIKFTLINLKFSSLTLFEYFLNYVPFKENSNTPRACVLFFPFIKILDSLLPLLPCPPASLLPQFPPSSRGSRA